MLKVDLNNHKLTDNDGKEHELSSNEFWCIVPKGTKLENPLVNPTRKLGFLLHNAHIGEGIAPAMTDLLKGIEIKCHKNHPFAKKSEEIF